MKTFTTLLLILFIAAVTITTTHVSYSFFYQRTENVDDHDSSYDRDPSLVPCEFLPSSLDPSIAKKLVFPPRRTSFRPCTEIALELLNQKPPLITAPANFPEELRPSYTLNGTIPITYEYHYDAYYGAKPPVAFWTIDQVNLFRNRTYERVIFGTYPEGGFIFYTVLDKWGPEFVWGTEGIVIGSASPWLESMLLEYGARHITTIEYGIITSQHPQIATIVPPKVYEKIVAGEWKQVDWIFTYSSIEHSGLGRYGDPLDPFGDLLVMQLAQCMIKPGGLLFLGFPVGHDTVVFNAHRIYGPKRLELVFDGWNLLDMVAVSEIILSEGPVGVYTNQPLLVLQNQRGCS